jgi:Peptidase A4 family
MARHWWIPVAAIAVVAGGAVAVATAAASASPGLTHQAVETAAVGAPIASPTPVSPGNPMISSGGGSVAGVAGNSAIARSVKSGNWSGYAVHAGKYRNVSATWIEPAAKCPLPKAKQYAAFWVGLDGYNSDSVEQTGTDSDCSGPTPHYYGWYEMFPAAPVFFKTQVKPGNEMSASVTFSGTDTYTLVLKNLSRRWTHTIVKHETGDARSSAEVITEAPSGPGVLPLADFGTVTFSSVRVSKILLKTLKPTAIVMVDGNGAAKDSTSPIANDRFHNTWIRRN